MPWVAGEPTEGEKREKNVVLRLTPSKSKEKKKKKRSKPLMVKDGKNHGSERLGIGNFQILVFILESFIQLISSYYLSITHTHTHTHTHHIAQFQLLSTPSIAVKKQVIQPCVSFSLSVFPSPFLFKSVSHTSPLPSFYKVTNLSTRPSHPTPPATTMPTGLTIVCILVVVCFLQDSRAPAAHHVSRSGSCEAQM